MGTLWIPGAERLPCSKPGGVITSTAPPRAVWHTTEAQPGTAAVWASMIRVLNSKSAEPQILYDPLTDRLGQFMALNLSGRALRNDGTYQTNRTGRVCIQIEVIAYAAKPFTNYWKPGKNFKAMIAALRSWGIAVDSWPAGPPPRFVADPPRNVPESPRSRQVWLSKGGYYGHSQVPGNNHGDPGGVDVLDLKDAGKPVTSAPPSAPPEEEFIMATKEELDELLQKWTVSREHWDSQAWAYLATAIAAAQKSMDGVDVTPAMVDTAMGEARAALSLLEGSFD